MLRTTEQPPYGGYAADPSHKQTLPVLPARQYTNYSKSSAFSSSANPDEDWTKIADLGERRRIQNRIAQRNYRKKIKRRLEDLQRRAGTPIGDVTDSRTGDHKSQSLSPSLSGSARDRSSRGGGSSSSSNSAKRSGARPPRQKKQQHTLTSLSAVEAAVLKKQQQKQQQEQLRPSSSSPFPSRQAFTPSLHGTDRMVLAISRSVSSSASSASSSSSAAPSCDLATAASLYNGSNIVTTLDALDDPLSGMTFEFFGSDATSVYSRGHSPLDLPFEQQRHPSPSAFTTSATTPLPSSGYSAYPPPPVDLASLSEGTRGGSSSDRSSGPSSSTTSGLYTTATASDPSGTADRVGSTASTVPSYEYTYSSSWPLVVNGKDAAVLTATSTLAPPYIDYRYLATVANGAYDACPPTPSLCSTYYSHDTTSCPETDFDFVGPTTPLSMAD